MNDCEERSRLNVEWPDGRRRVDGAMHQRIVRGLLAGDITVKDVETRLEETGYRLAKPQHESLELCEREYAARRSELPAFTGEAPDGQV